MDEQRTTTQPRRDFLRKTWITAAVAALLGYPLFRFLAFKVPRQPRQVRVTKVLAPGAFYQDQDFVLFDGPDGPWAVSRKCTHLGCRINYLEKDGLLVCPCHQSRFATDGRLISGPARRDLELFKVERLERGDEQGYIVTLNG